MARLASARPPAPRPYRRGAAGFAAACIGLLVCAGVLPPAPVSAWNTPTIEDELGRTSEAQRPT